MDQPATWTLSLVAEEDVEPLAVDAGALGDGVVQELLVGLGLPRAAEVVRRYADRRDALVDRRLHTGLPIALQLVGPLGSEAALCRAGYAYEQATDFIRNPEV